MPQLLYFFYESGFHLGVGVIQVLAVGEFNLHIPYLYLVDIDKLVLSFARCVRGYHHLVNCTVLGLAQCGQPLEGQRWPFHLVHQQPVVEVAAILHPDLVLLLGAQLLGLVHLAPDYIEYIIYMIREILNKSRNKRQLYKNKLVCGCLYRSFSDL